MRITNRSWAIRLACRRGHHLSLPALQRPTGCDRRELYEQFGSGMIYCTYEERLLGPTMPWTVFANLRAGGWRPAEGNLRKTARLF